MSYNICALSGKLTSNFVICRKNGLKEIGELKFKLSESRKQLTAECYKYEAAINVIHKLIQEKEIAKSQIEQYQSMIQNK